jgi:hypothetical protein
MQYSRGSKFIITVRPKLAPASVTNIYTANDMLFGWTGFSFPKHPFAAKLIGLTMTAQSADVVAQTTNDVTNIFFAQPNPDGTAPPALGPEHGALPTIPVDGTPIRNYLGRVDTKTTDDDDLLPYASFLSLPNGVDVADALNLHDAMILGAEANSISETAEGGKLYIAARTEGAPIFGTLIAMNADQAATTTATTITVKTKDPRKVFSIGDTIHAADGAEVGVLTGFGDAAGANKDTKLIFGGGIVEALEEDDELINLQPITIRLMFEA